MAPGPARWLAAARPLVGPRPARPRERVVDATLAARLFVAGLVMAAGLAPVASSHDGAASSALAALAETWRWQAVERGGLPTGFRCVGSLPGGDLLLADDAGLWTWAGLDWNHVPGSEQLDLSSVTHVTRIGETWVSSGAAGLALLGAGEPPRISQPVEASAPVGTTPPVRDPADRLVLAAEGHVIEISAAGPVARVALPPGSARCGGLGFDAAGGLWITTGQGVFRHAGQAWERVPVTGSIRKEGDLGRVLRSADGMVFLPRIFSRDQTGLLWDGRQLLPLGEVPAQGLVVADLVLPDGSILVSVEHSGLLLLAGRQWETVRLPPRFDEALVSLALAEGERVAAVSRSGRLLLHDRASRRWTLHDDWGGRISRIVNVLAPSERGGFWLGTHEGIARFDQGELHDVQLTAGPGGRPLFGITALHEDSQGRLWVGAGGDLPGVLCWDGADWHHEQDPAIFRGDSVHRIRVGPDGALWFLLLSLDPARWLGGGVAVLRDGTWTRETAADGADLGRAYDVAFDPDGSAILGLPGSLAQRTSDGWSQWPGLPFGAGGKTFAVFRSRDGALWAGTDLWRPGLARRPADAAADGFQRLAGPEWNRVAAASFAETADGSLWITSQAGLVRVRDGLCLPVDAEGVLPDPAFWPVLADRDGDGLWIGTLGSGLLHHRPDDDGPPQTRLLTNSRPEDGGHGTRVVSWRGADAWGVSPPDRLRFRQRLDGGPWSDWSLPGADASLRTPDLATGAHLLELQALDEAGNREEPPLAIPLEIPRRPPPEWARPPLLVFALALAVAVGGLAWFALRRRRELLAASRARAELTVRLRDLASWLMTTREEERRSLSRDLHDDLGQLLTATCMHLQHGLASAPGAHREQALAFALDAARKSLQSMRDLAARVRPPALDHLGLEGAVQDALDDFAASTGLAVTSKLRLDGRAVPQDTAEHLWRILKEGLTNVARHAGARHVHVVLSVQPDDVTLVVNDDGRGFRPVPGSEASGVGLLGMRERAESLSGTFAVDSAPGRGTTLRVQLPLPPRETEQAP